MVREETIRAQVAATRRKRNRALTAVASAGVFCGISLLFLFSLDYTTPLFKLAGVAVVLFVTAFFAAVWIASGAHIDMEEHRQKLTGRRR